MDFEYLEGGERRERVSGEIIILLAAERISLFVGAELWAGEL